MHIWFKIVTHNNYYKKQVQEKNKDVDIGSYPFFRKGKIGISIVLTSKDQSKIDKCSSQILEFIKEKKIKIVERD